MKRIFLEPLAKADVEAAFVYYQHADPGRGEQFKERLRVQLTRIREFPLTFPEIEPGIRWGLLKQFPFKIFFLAEEDPIRVIAVTHAVMRPDAWKRRQQ